jgi:hypothetical protein
MLSHLPIYRQAPADADFPLPLLHPGSKMRQLRVEDQEPSALPGKPGSPLLRRCVLLTTGTLSAGAVSADKPYGVPQDGRSFFPYRLIW